MRPSLPLPLALTGLFILAAPSAQAQICPGDDIYAGNSDCFSTLPLSNVSAPLNDLASLQGVDDYFDVEVLPDQTLEVDLAFSHAQADLDLFAYDSTVYACNNQIGVSNGTSDQESWTFHNTSGNPMVISLKVEFYGSSAGNNCNPYTMDWSVTGGDPCVVGDGLDNHSCSQYSTINGRLLETEYVVSDSESDYFRLRYYPSDYIHVRIEFDHAAGDIDMAVYSEHDCDGTPLARSESVGNYEEFTVPSTSELNLKIYRYGGPGNCNSYRLTVLRGGATTLGGAICEGNLNSTGWWASLAGRGSKVVADNDFTLTASGLPQNSFGFYLNSTGVGHLTPPGSAGEICINEGGIGRFVRPGEIKNSGTQGYTQLPVDLTSIPRPTGTDSVMVGDRWSFQYWYRDGLGGGSSGSNFTDAIIVYFD